MKKILSVLLCMVLLLGLLVVPANATDDVVTFSITTDHEGVLLRGQEITCVVYVNGTQTVDQIGFLMDTLDTDVFEITKVTSGIRIQADEDELLTPTVASLVSAGAKRKGVAVSWDAGVLADQRGLEDAEGVGVTLPGTLKLCTVKLKVKDTAAFADAEIIGSGSANLGATRYNIDVQGLTVTIAKCVGHQYGAWTNADETNHARTCSLCGDVETATHNWDLNAGVEKVPATCDQPGTKTVTCTDCSATKDVETPATGNHVDADNKWESNENQHFHTCAGGTEFDHADHTGGEATCKVQANCSVCGAAYGELNKDNHKNTEIRDAATPSCNEPGYTGDTWCKDCETKIGTGTSIDPTGEHVDADNKWESNENQHFHTCSCGTKFDFTNHSGGEATCKVQANCSACGAAYGELNKDNHKNTEIRGAFNPSCNEPGYTGDTWCKDCETKIETGTSIDPTGAHVDADDKWEANGDQHYHTCGCGTKFDFTDHTASAWEKVDNDTHKRNCTVCGLDEEIASHNWDNGTVTKPNDCGNDGVKTYTCKDNCGATKTEVIAATNNHTAGAWQKVDNDTHKRVCSVCGKNEETASHDWNEGTVTKPNDCGNDGVKTYTCKDNCGATKTEVIAATGNHTAGAWQKVDNNTHKRVCSVCGKNEETASHTWNAGEETTKPGCGSEGVKTFTCTDNCGATKTEAIPATGNHTWDEGVVTKNPTAAADGIVTHGCVDCDATKEVPFNVTYEIVADKEAAKRGDEITYTIYISSNKALTNVNLDLNLDSNIFEIVSGETKLPGATNSFDEANGFGAVFTEAQMVEGKVVFGTITVKVKTDADFGDIKVQGTPSVQGGSGNLAYAFAAVPTVKIECDTHAFSAWTKVDDKEHTHTCSVCQKAETAAHKWDAGKVTVEATETKVGEKTFTCADCGAVKTEEIAKTIPVTADTMNPALYMILMVLAVAGVAVVTVGKKKFHG